MQEMSPQFFQCWQAAGAHLNKQVHGGIQSWLRANPYPPFLEHLSFRIENQLFFVRIEDVAGIVEGPGTRRGLRAVAEGNRGHACLLPMKRLSGDTWIPDRKGWGLVDVVANKPIDPVALITNEKIEMTAWELQDMAVQVVRDYLKKQDYQLMSWQSNPAVDPAIWFVGDSTGPEWVVVRSTRYPANRASRPTNWETIASQCACRSPIGHFASVAIVCAEQQFQSQVEATVPLWRGHGMYVRFTGLE